MTDDAPFLICLPTKRARTPPTPLAVKRLCSRCQAQVWLTPTGIAVQREHGAVLLCIPCWAADKSLSANEDVKATPLNAAQQREIADATGAPAIDADIEEMLAWMKKERG